MSGYLIYFLFSGPETERQRQTDRQRENSRWLCVCLSASPKLLGWESSSIDKGYIIEMLHTWKHFSRKRKCFFFSLEVWGQHKYTSTDLYTSAEWLWFAHMIRLLWDADEQSEFYFTINEYWSIFRRAEDIIIWLHSQGRQKTNLSHHWKYIEGACC